MTKRIVFISCILLLFCINLSQAQEDPRNDIDILVLLGLDEMGIWENDFTQELFESLKAETHFNISLHHQFLGLNTIVNDEEPSELINYLERRASDTQYDVVMALLPSANQFLVTYGEALYPDIPKLYVLPSNSSFEAIQTQDTLSVAIQNASTSAIENTINNIVTVLPDTEHLYIISGSGNGDRAYTQRTEAILEASPLEGIEVSYLIGLTQAELREESRQLPEGSAILFLVYERDRELNTYISVEAVEDLSLHANAPIFVFFDTLIGRGAVGGNVTSSTLYAQSAVNLLMQLIQGELTHNTITLGDTAYIYDWRELQRWDIDETLLPPNSHVEFRVLTLWEEYHTSIVLIILVIILQALSIIALTWLYLARRSALQSVHKSETEFRAVFENSLDAVAVSHQDIIVMCNPAYVKLFGYKHADELVGQSVITVVEDSEKSRVAEYVKNRNLGQDVVTKYETWGQSRDGHKFEIDVHISTYILNDTFHTIAIIRDISERKKLEEMTRNAEGLRIELKKEQEIVALKERFVSIISHDFRTPLSVIQTSAYLLKKYGINLSKGKLEENLEKISRQATNLNDMIEKMLPLVRSEKQSIVLKPVEIDIHEFCVVIIEQIRIIDKHQHDFLLIDNAQKKSIALDPSLMRQILANLITNAMKFSPNRSEIIIELSSNATEFIMSVKDKGRGIPQEDLETLFIPFTRAINADDIQGTGLGLSIVKEYVELHKGHIEVASILGEGTTFTIHLPI